MKSFMPLILATLVASPVVARPIQTVSAAAAVKTPSAKPCEPAAPEATQNGELIYSACQVRAMGGKIPELKSSPKDPDLSDLYRQGVQGSVVFEVIIGKDGHLRNVSVKTSSRSPELDAIGIGLLNASTFSPGTDHSGNPVDVRARLPMYFWKDSMTNPDFVNKSCRQFLIDTGWHAEHFPEEKPEAYRGWLLATGMLMVSSLRADGLSANGQKHDFPKAPAYSDVVEACKAKPDKRFFDVLTGR